MKTCTKCGDRFTGEEIAEWRADHEAFQESPLICPDCWDTLFAHKDLEDQFQEAMNEAL